MKISNATATSYAKPLQLDGDDGFEAPAIAPEQPKPLFLDDGFEPSIAKPTAGPTLAGLAESAPRPFMEEVLVKAGLDEATLAKLDDTAIADAFAQVVNASGKPGTHEVTVKFQETVKLGENSESGAWYGQEERTQTLSFKSKSIGDVNGLKLNPAAVAGAVETARFLDNRAVSESLAAMGVENPDSLGEAGMRELLASALIAARTPGSHSVSLRQTVTMSTGGDGGEQRTEVHEHTATFRSDKKGNVTVGGRPLPTAELIAMSRSLESLPLETKQAELINAGFPEDIVMTITPEETHRALTHVSLELAREGGVQTFEVMLGGDDFRVTPQLDAAGKLESLGIEKKEKKKSGWKKFTDGLKKIVGPVLTVLSFIPITAPFAMAANAVLSVVNGIRNKNPLGIIAGLAGGIGQIATSIGSAAANGIASVAQTVGNVANTAGAALAAIRGKNPASILGLIASAAGNLATAVGDGANGFADTLRGIANGASQAQQVAGAIDAVRNRDFGALIGLGASSLGLGRNDDGFEGPDGIMGPEYVPQPGDADFMGPLYVPQPGDADFMGPLPLEEVFGPPAPETPSYELERPKPAGRITVKPGDTLTALAQQHLGDARLAPALYAYNLELLGGDPNKLRIGDKLELPPEGWNVSQPERDDFWRESYVPRRETEAERLTIGYDEEGEPVRTTAAERAAVKEEVSSVFTQAGVEEGLDVLKRMTKIADSLGPLGQLLQHEGVFAEVLRKGDPAILGRALADSEFAQKVMDALEVNNPEAYRRFAVLKEIASVGAKGIAAYEGFNEAASTSLDGKAWAALGSVAAELMAGGISKLRNNPWIEIIDGVIQAGAQMAPEGPVRTGLESIGINKNFNGTYEAIFALSEGIFGSPGKREDVLARFVEKARAGRAGIVVEGYTQLGREVASPAVMWVMDRFQSSIDAAALARYQAQQLANLRRRNLDRARSG